MDDNESVTQDGTQDPHATVVSFSSPFASSLPRGPSLVLSPSLPPVSALSTARSLRPVDSNATADKRGASNSRASSDTSCTPKRGSSTPSSAARGDRPATAKAAKSQRHTLRALTGASPAARSALKQPSTTVLVQSPSRPSVGAANRRVSFGTVEFVSIPARRSVTMSTLDSVDDMEPMPLSLELHDAPASASPLRNSRLPKDDDDDADRELLIAPATATSIRDSDDDGEGVVPTPQLVKPVASVCRDVDDDLQEVDPCWPSASSRIASSQDLATRLSSAALLDVAPNNSSAATTPPLVKSVPPRHSSTVAPKPVQPQIVALPMPHPLETTSAEALRRTPSDPIPATASISLSPYSLLFGGNVTTAPSPAVSPVAAAGGQGSGAGMLLVSSSSLLAATVDEEVALLPIPMAPAAVLPSSLFAPATVSSTLSSSSLTASISPRVPLPASLFDASAKFSSGGSSNSTGSDSASDSDVDEEQALLIGTTHVTTPAPPPPPANEDTADMHDPVDDDDDDDRPLVDVLLPRPASSAAPTTTTTTTPSPVPFNQLGSHSPAIPMTMQPSSSTEAPQLGQPMNSSALLTPHPNSFPSVAALWDIAMGNFDAQLPSSQGPLCVPALQAPDARDAESNGLEQWRIAAQAHDGTPATQEIDLTAATSSEALPPSFLDRLLLTGVSQAPPTQLQQHHVEAAIAPQTPTAAPICELCGLGEHFNGLGTCGSSVLVRVCALPDGRLVLPVGMENGVEGDVTTVGAPTAWWLHIECALWSPEAYSEVLHPMQGTSSQGNIVVLQRVGELLGRGRSIKCAACRQPGATLGCLVSTCQRSYHFPCAVNASQAGLVMDTQNLVLRCEHHAKPSRPTPTRADDAEQLDDASRPQRTSKKRRSRDKDATLPDCAAPRAQPVR